MATIGTAARPAASGVFNPHRDGLHYLRFMKKFARAWQPRGYLEIGTRTGDSLAMVDCASIAVDPEFRLDVEVMGSKPALHLFQLTSDDFFARHDARVLLAPTGGLDLAFLDGLHHFEFLLRDFINTERAAGPGAGFFLHDCFPVRPNVAKRLKDDRDFMLKTRLRTMGGWSGWTGDVWKVLRALRRWRPELQVFCLDCPPSGLVFVTGLDPANTVLADNYEAILAEGMDVDLVPGWFEDWHAANPLVGTRPLADDALWPGFIEWIRAHRPGQPAPPPPAGLRLAPSC